MKRKIAICISGRPRYLEEGFQEINRYILSKYDCDVFIHTWWSSDMSNQAEQFSPKISYNRSYIYPENTIDIIIEIPMTNVLANSFSSTPTGVKYLISLFIDSIY